MCGICGIFYYRDSDRRVNELDLIRMASKLKHRGPDGEGFFFDSNLGLGHRRLSIIDTSDNANQPMQSKCGRYSISFNGEIYNYIELRAELEKMGYSFTTSSDTEVLLNVFQSYGIDCLELLNGIFSFAIWDKIKKELFIARDRFGVKPLYYFISAGAIYFASEIKSILTCSIIPKEVNYDALMDYFAFQFCLGAKTLFRGIEKLMPGHYMLVSQSKGIDIKKYWEIDYHVDNPCLSEDGYIEQLKELIQDSVKLQLRSDVPIGAYLSGGIDSTSITGLASKELDSLSTFSGGFDEGAKFDESYYSDLGSRHFVTKHFKVLPSKEDFVASMPKITYFMDEPVAGPGAFPQYHVSKLASQHVKVVLGGQGGDELFGGYARYLLAYLEECIKGGIDGTNENPEYVVTFESILPNLVQLSNYKPMMASFWQNGLFEERAKRYFRLIDRSSSIRDIIKVDCLDMSDNGYNVFDEYKRIFEAKKHGSYINMMTDFDLQTLLPALLHVEDRMSMAFSIESRVPLLDHRIAELVAKIPPKIKFKGGRTKHILKESIKDLIPKEIYLRTDKMGFPVPLAEWCKQKGIVRDFVYDTLNSQKSRDRGLFNINSLRDNDKFTKSFDRGLWGLLSIELWMREFIDAK